MTTVDSNGLPRRKRSLRDLPAAVGNAVDERLQVAAPSLRATLLNKVYPDHWSFLLGEVALWSFVILLLTGTFLALFFEPSMEHVVYDGSYHALRGVEMSAAYASKIGRASCRERAQISVGAGAYEQRKMHAWPTTATS